MSSHLPCEHVSSPNLARATGNLGRDLVNRSFMKSHAILFEKPRFAGILLRVACCAAHNNFRSDQE
jgi:hypothetical protein